MKRTLGVVVALIVLAFAFQVFFRYDYVHQGARLVRIDRLTQSTCVVRLARAPIVPPLPSGAYSTTPTTIYCSD
jgi:hypothetical protein